MSEPAKRNHVMPETVCMAAICLLDAAATIYLVQTGKAHEANPLLAWCFQHGTATFILTKVTAFLPALVIIELSRPRVGDFGRLALRIGISAYLAFYVIGTVTASR